jgi:hypothetical protein
MQLLVFVSEPNAETEASRSNPQSARVVVRAVQMTATVQVAAVNPPWLAVVVRVVRIPEMIRVDDDSPVVVGMSVKMRWTVCVAGAAAVTGVGGNQSARAEQGSTEQEYSDDCASHDSYSWSRVIGVG